jgi:hypothetical protein
MVNQSQREEHLWRELDAQQSDIKRRLLPMIRLCLFASRAAAMLSDLQVRADLSPEFKEALWNATEFPDEPSPSEAHQLVANVLNCAERTASEMDERITTTFTKNLRCQHE